MRGLVMLLRYVFKHGRCFSSNKYSSNRPLTGVHKEEVFFYYCKSIMRQFLFLYVINYMVLLALRASVILKLKIGRCAPWHSQI
jgi:hypothetical protein